MILPNSIIYLLWTVRTTRDVIAKANHQNEVDKVELLCEAAGLGMRPVPDPYFGDDEDSRRFLIL